MPRIEPVQLLTCLHVLLSPSGGIKSKDEVQRLASLMTKFSKKLVSKCIYIQILKNTESVLLGSFMGAGGWNLTHMWITEGILAKNWPLVQELLELLLICPVDVERLKTNNCPKLVKELSKDECHTAVRHLASKLVEQWLKLVKGEVAYPLELSQVSKVVPPQADSVQNVQPSTEETQCNIISTSHKQINHEDGGTTIAIDETNDALEEDCSDGANTEVEQNQANVTQGLILKISVKDGVVSQVEDKSDHSERQLDSNKKSESRKDKENDKSKRKEADRHKSSSSRNSSSKSSSSSSRNSSKYNSSSDRDKSGRSSSSSSGSNSRSSNIKSSKEKDSKSSSSRSKDKSKSLESKRKSNNEIEKSRETSSDDKAKNQADKIRETLKIPSSSAIMKLAKIPKKSLPSSGKSEEKKDKHSISIEVRKPNDPNRPKTVKTYNSKFRSHGLEEEAKPPVPRGSVKKPTSSPSAVSVPSLKRASPIRSADVPPEKKPKVSDHSEKLCAIKLIPAKPKPSIYLLESDMFMDALNASATNKKEPRKRKRKNSGSKDAPTSEGTTPPASPPSSNTPDAEASKSTPFRFYQDTLDTEEEDKDKENNVDVKKEVDEKHDIFTAKSPLASPPAESKKNDEKNLDDLPNIKLELLKTEEKVSISGLKGVLCVVKKKGPKKSLRWRDNNLEEIQYFELDETERVNVTKTFLDMKHMERVNEREAFQKSRNLPNDDVMEEKIAWRILIPISIESAISVDYGKISNEKNIQAAREKVVLQSLYFDPSMIPDFPAEADLEIQTYKEPILIPLEDLTGNLDTVNDLQNTPWPEPKAAPPQTLNNGMGMMPQMFQPLPSFGPGFNQFGMPGFPPGPNIMQGDWPPNGPNMMMSDGMNMVPDMFMGPGSGPGPGPGQGPGPGPGPGPVYPGQLGSNDFSMMENVNGPVYPMNFPGQLGPNGPSGSMGPPGMNGPPGINVHPGPFGFGGNRGGGGGGGGGPRGPGPRGGHSAHWRGKGPNWNGPPRGNSHRGGRLCTHFERKGFCRQGDSCAFLHPGVNCPY